MPPFYKFLTPALALALLACSEDGSSPLEPVPSTATMTVDASAGFAYVDFIGNDAQAIAISSAGTATNWDLGFNATNIVLNNTTNGPGTVQGYCLCQNASATPAQVMAFTAAGELADFEAVTRAQAPANASAWQNDVFTSSKWYRYNLTGTDHQVWPTYEVFLIKQGNDIYKVQFTGYYGAGGEPRRISFRYARLTQ